MSNPIPDAFRRDESREFIDPISFAQELADARFNPTRMVSPAVRVGGLVRGDFQRRGRYEIVKKLVASVFNVDLPTTPIEIPADNELIQQIAFTVPLAQVSGSHRLSGGSFQ